MSATDDRGVPTGYRQGIITAITVFLGFSLTFLRYWTIEPSSGDWKVPGVIAAIVLGAGIVAQLVALYRALRIADNEPREYARTVSCFFWAVVLTIAGFCLAIVAAAWPASA
jgi:hypothetical protein